MNFPEDPFISGRHCQVMALDDGRFQVSDLGSKNGTYEKLTVLSRSSLATSCSWASSCSARRAQCLSNVQGKASVKQRGTYRDL